MVFGLVLGFPGSHSLRRFVKPYSKQCTIDQSQRALSFSDDLGLADEVRQLKCRESSFDDHLCYGVDRESKGSLTSFLTMAKRTI